MGGPWRLLGAVAVAMAHGADGGRAHAIPQAAVAGVVPGGEAAGADACRAIERTGPARWG